MSLLPRTPRGTILLAAIVWLSGASVIWYTLPVAPRRGWQPTEDAIAIGFLTDSKTVITAVGRFGNKGPIQALDVDSGELRAACLTADDRIHVSPTATPNHFIIDLFLSWANSNSPKHAIVLFDAQNFRDVWR